MRTCVHHQPSGRWPHAHAICIDNTRSSCHSTPSRPTSLTAGPAVWLSCPARASRVVAQRYICWMHTTPSILMLLKMISTTITPREVRLWEPLALAITGTHRGS